MTNQPDSHLRPQKSRLRFTYIALALCLALFIVALIYSAWARTRQHEADMPVPALETVVLALRTFHKQTGRFPKDFRELDERLWKGAKRVQLSTDGKSLNAPNAHYYYTLHTIPTGQGAREVEPVKAALWAVPIGARASEAATYLWYVTPDNIERWMGPALTSENIGAVQAIPSEQQLALLMMTRQTSAMSLSSQSSKGILPIFGF